MITVRDAWSLVPSGCVPEEEDRRLSEVFTNGSSREPPLPFLVLPENGHRMGRYPANGQAQSPGKGEFMCQVRATSPKRADCDS